MLLGGMGLLDLASGDAGAGGVAESGPAVPGSGPIALTGPGSSTTTDPNNSSGSTTNSFGNAYSGAGGDAEGGSISNNPALIRLLSGNGGEGGKSSSGSSGFLLSSLGFGSPKGSPKRGGRTRVARFYKINLD